MTEEADKPLKEMEAEEGDFAEELPGADEAPAHKPSGPSLLPLILAVVALLAVLALAAFGYQQKQGVEQIQAGMQQRMQQSLEGMDQANAQIAQLSEIIDQQNRAVEQQKQQLTEMTARLEQERGRYQQGRQETLQALNALQRRMGRSTSRWMAAEAEYLVRVANHRLQLEADPRTALSALQAADERLRDTADPLWTPVREVLAEDIARLKGLAPPDYAGLSARLAGLAKQVAKLPVKSALLNQPLIESEQEGQPPLDWQKILTDGWQGFRSLVVVRRHDQPVAAMLPPEQRFFLGQNLRLQLESARLALLRRDQALFDGALRIATAWLTEYFEMEDPAAAALAKELVQLSEVKVRMEVPDVSGALVVLKQQMELSRLEGNGEADR